MDTLVSDVLTAAVSGLLTAGATLGDAAGLDETAGASTIVATAGVLDSLAADAVTAVDAAGFADEGTVDAFNEVDVAGAHGGAAMDSFTALGATGPGAAEDAVGAVARSLKPTRWMARRASSQILRYRSIILGRVILSSSSKGGICRSCRKRHSIPPMRTCCAIASALAFNTLCCIWAAEILGLFSRMGRAKVSSKMMSNISRAL